MSVPSAPERRPRLVDGARTGVDAAALVAVLVALRVVLWALDPRVAVYGGRGWHFLDTAVLEQDFLGSLVLLHAQPPLLNFVGGLGLLVSHQWFPPVTRVVWSVLGLGIALGAYSIVRSVGAGRAAAWACGLLVGAHPGLLLAERAFFYEVPAGAAFTAIVASLLIATRTGGLRWLFVASLAASVLALTKSLFLPAFALAVTVLAAGLRRVQVRTLRARDLVVLALPLALPLAWVAKNAVMFGSASTSTWVGINVFGPARAFVPDSVLAGLEARGVISRFWRTSTRTGHTFSYIDDYPIPFLRPARAHPAVAAAVKSTGDPNFNYEGYIAVSRALFREAIAIVRAYPSGLLRSARTNVAVMAQGSDAYPWPFEPPLDGPIVPWQRAFDSVVYGKWLSAWVGRTWPGVAGGRPQEKSPVVLLAVPAVLLGLAALAVRKRGTPQSLAAGGVLVMLLYTLGLMCVGNLGETDRMLLTVEPTVVAFAVAGAGALLGRLGAVARRPPVGRSTG